MHVDSIGMQLISKAFMVTSMLEQFGYQKQEVQLQNGRDLLEKF